MSMLLRPTSVASVMSLPSSQRYPFEATDCVRLSRDELGNKTINQYVVLGELGRGSQGKVKLAEDSETGRIVAVKIMNKSPKKQWWRFSDAAALDRIEREIEIMKKLKHKNIVQLFEVIDDPSHNKLYLVMQYVESGPVCRMLHQDASAAAATVVSCTYAEDRVRAVVRQVVTALRYLHRHGIVHRDVKPENILLGSSDAVYLADFGVAEIFDDKHSAAGSRVVSCTIGTPLFFAPEMFDTAVPHAERDNASTAASTTRPSRLSICSPLVDDEPSAPLGPPVDVWALGVTAFCLMFGRPPFGSTRSRVSLASEVRTQSLTFPVPVDDIVRHFFERMLDKNPRTRLTLAQAKRHPFLTRSSLSARRRSSFIVASQLRDTTTTSTGSFVDEKDCSTLPHIASSDAATRSSISSVWSDATTPSKGSRRSTQEARPPKTIFSVTAVCVAMLFVAKVLIRAKARRAKRFTDECGTLLEHLPASPLQPPDEVLNTTFIKSSFFSAPRTPPRSRDTVPFAGTPARRSHIVVESPGGDVLLRSSLLEVEAGSVRNVSEVLPSVAPPRGAPPLQSSPRKNPDNLCRRSFG